jgi:hypothetical protein
MHMQCATTIGSCDFFLYGIAAALIPNTLFRH